MSTHRAQHHSPASYPPRTSSPSTSTPSLPQHPQPSASPRDTAYNGSEGYIGESFNQLVLTPPTVPASPPKALSARFLSSISNAQPAAAALTRKGSVLHSRAKSSLAAYVPRLNAVNGTPEKTEKPHVPNKIFGDLFHGESAPIRLGAPVSPTKEKEESDFVMEYYPSFTERPSGMFTRRPTTESSKNIAPPRKTSWFTRRTTSTPKPSSTDDLATLNIPASLFPNGQPDPLNPASFNDLLLNATNLLTRMQTAYKEKVDFISSLQPELDVQREEVEEAETRSQHLKMQLQDLASQAQEHETAMQELARQLAEEKMRAQEAREAYEAARTVRLVDHQCTCGEEGAATTTARRRKRNSGASASDSGFESDLDSVFSVNTASGTDTPATSRSVFARQQLKGPVSRAGNQGRIGGEQAAWMTVEALRGENRDLRVQVEEMQRSLQGCIDLVSI